MALELHATAELPCAVGIARAELETLDGYPTWLGIVTGVDAAAPDDADPGPAWWVDLGGKVGMIRKTKRVRMVRTVHAENLIRFERLELDGRRHHAWVLEARLIASEPETTSLEMAVHYGGDRRVPVLDAVLRAEVRRAGRRLVGRIAGVG